MTAPYLWTLDNTVTVMAVRTQRKLINSLSLETLDRYYMLSDRLNVFMADPRFDLTEFSRLCRVYELD